MGRSVPTYRSVLDTLLGEWMKFRRALRPDDREAFDRLVERARRHACAGSYMAPEDPFHAAVLSILLEMEKEMERMMTFNDSLRAEDSGCGGDRLRGTDSDAMDF